MKRLFLTSVIILCGIIPSMAQVASATIFTENGEHFWIILNGVKQNPTSQTNVKLTGLTDPFYKIKVLFEDETIPAMDENLPTQDLDGTPLDVTYVIKKKDNGKYAMRRMSFKPATAPANTQAVVPVNQSTQQQNNAGGSSTTIVTQQTTTTGNPNNGNVSMSMGDGMGGGVNINMNVSGMDMNNGTTTTTTTTTHSVTTATNSDYPVNNTPPPPPMPERCMYPMNSNTFSNAKNQVEGQGFEEQKLQVAKQVLKANCASTAQIKEIMGLFGFEQTKVAYAKFAYDRCTDTGNYFNLNDAFSFSSSVTELNNYINSK